MSAGDQTLLAELSRYGEVEQAPLGRIQRYVARAMEKNWSAIPHVTTHDDADITEFEHRRKDYNSGGRETKLTLLAPLVKVVAAVLQKHPVFNTSLAEDGNTLLWKRYVNVGVAVDTAEGLLVPVIHDPASRDVGAIAREIASLAEKARNKGLSMKEMSGGCFTVSSIGHVGGTGFTPIINAPEVAILGVSRAMQRLIPDQAGSPVARTFLPLSLSYDHRVINGVAAAAFLRALTDGLAAFEF